MLRRDLVISYLCRRGCDGLVSAQREPPCRWPPSPLQGSCQFDYPCSDACQSHQIKLSVYRIIHLTRMLRPLRQPLLKLYSVDICISPCAHVRGSHGRQPECVLRPFMPRHPSSPRHQTSTKLGHRTHGRHKLSARRCRHLDQHLKQKTKISSRFTV